MGNEMTSVDLKRAVAAVREGRELPNGPILPRFDPESLALAIEQECSNVRSMLDPRVSLVFDPPDALDLVTFLRTRNLETRSFGTCDLANIVESEIRRVEGIANRKIVIHLRPDGALCLAQFLRFRSA